MKLRQLIKIYWNCFDAGAFRLCLVIFVVGLSRFGTLPLEDDIRSSDLRQQIMMRIQQLPNLHFLHYFLEPTCRNNLFERLYYIHDGEGLRRI